MGSWSVPTMVEVRLAERMLEAERVRLARSAETRPQDRSGVPVQRSPLVGAVLTGSLILGGLMLVGGVAASGSVAPVPAPLTMASADVYGEWLYLAGGIGIGRLTDERVSGMGWHTFEPPPSESGRSLFGELVLEGPDGQWVGRFATTWATCLCEAEIFTGAGQVVGVEGVFALEGTEAYEGWSFVGSWSDPMTGAPAQVSGRIDQGHAHPVAGLMATLGSGIQTDHALDVAAAPG